MEIVLLLYLGEKPPKYFVPLIAMGKYEYPQFFLVSMSCCQSLGLLHNTPLSVSVTWDCTRGWDLPEIVIQFCSDMEFCQQPVFIRYCLVGFIELHRGDSDGLWCYWKFSPFIVLGRKIIFFHWARGGEKEHSLLTWQDRDLTPRPWD